MTSINLNVKVDMNTEQTMKSFRKILYQLMTQMQDTAVRLAPVDTGRLRNSINITPLSPGKDNYILHDGVNYGVHQEFGTNKMQAQPFMRPALAKAKAVDLPRLFKKEFGRPK